MRSFSTSGAFSKALSWVKKQTTQDVQWVQSGVEVGVSKKPNLAARATRATIEFANLLSASVFLLTFEVAILIQLQELMAVWTPFTLRELSQAPAEPYLLRITYMETDFSDFRGQNTGPFKSLPQKPPAPKLLKLPRAPRLRHHI